jgi:hypothetical protein
MDYNDFDWDQKIINDIFMDINVELNKPKYKPVYNSEIINYKEIPKKNSQKEEEIVYIPKDTNKNNLQYTEQEDILKEDFDKRNYNTFPDDEIMGIKFPYSKKFYILLTFILFLICIYMYNMINRYDAMLFMILQNKNIV